jgi:hypothetical protein
VLTRRRRNGRGRGQLPSAGLSRGPGTAQRDKGTPAPSSCPVNLNSTTPGLGRACRRTDLAKLPARPGPGPPGAAGVLTEAAPLPVAPVHAYGTLRLQRPVTQWQRGSGESPAELTASSLVYHGRRLHAGADLRAGGLLGAPQRSARVLSRLSPPTHPPGGPLVSVPKPTTGRLPGGSSAGLVHARPSSLQSPACVKSAAFCHSDPRFAGTQWPLQWPTTGTNARYPGYLTAQEPAADSCQQVRALPSRLRDSD